MTDINIYTKYYPGGVVDFVCTSENGIIKVIDFRGCSGLDGCSGMSFEVRVRTIFTKATIDCDSLDEVFQIVAEELG